ncbi:MAG: type II toxin-antitoxin system HicB family antitoxin [Planctomycetes bacterium]|nr:type II toxin-antitoxin system HicB family antitoxin [Planctomycetota bacterium]
MKPRRQVYLVCFEQEVDGTFSAYVPVLPGCYSQGVTLEEARANIVEAIQAYNESVKKDRLPLYDPSRAVIGNVEVEA